MYYRGSNAAIIVYDVTSMESFADVKTWIEGQSAKNAYSGRLHCAKADPIFPAVSLAITPQSSRRTWATSLSSTSLDRS